MGRRKVDNSRKSAVRRKSGSGSKHFDLNVTVFLCLLGKFWAIWVYLFEFSPFPHFKAFRSTEETIMVWIESVLNRHLKKGRGRESKRWFMFQLLVLVCVQQPQYKSIFLFLEFYLKLVDNPSFFLLTEYTTSEYEEEDTSDSSEYMFPSAFLIDNVLIFASVLIYHYIPGFVDNDFRFLPNFCGYQCCCATFNMIF